MFSYQSVLSCVVGAQTNRLIETVLLSTQNISFEREIRKLMFDNALLSRSPIKYGIVQLLVIMQLSED